MNEISRNNVTQALSLLAETAAEHLDAIEQYDPEPDCPDSDDDNDSSSPIFDKFYDSGGSGAILQMTNFTPDKIESIWLNMEDSITQVFCSGRGKKSAVKPKDCLFMLLTVLKHGGNWDFLAKMFNCKGPNFERLMIKYCKAISPILYKQFVEEAEQRFTYKRLFDRNRLFANHPSARYATDVCFQQSNRPSGNMQEALPWYSGKHKLYGYKFEASVLSTGMCISCSSHARAGRSDLEILQSRSEFHARALRKRTGELEIEDNDDGHDYYTAMWSILVDKGYQGIKEFLRGIHPIRKPPNRILSPSENRYNAEVSSDRIIVENYFGRLLSLWGVLSHKWRWAEDNYDMMLFLSVALTNIHIQGSPLRENDGEFYQKYKNRLLDIGIGGYNKRRLTQKRYREKRQRQMNIQFRALNCDGNENESS